MNLEAVETKELIDFYKKTKEFLSFLEKEQKQYNNSK